MDHHRKLSESSDEGNASDDSIELPPSLNCKSINYMIIDNDNKQMNFRNHILVLNRDENDLELKTDKSNKVVCICNYLL